MEQILLSLKQGSPLLCNQSQPQGNSTTQAYQAIGGKDQVHRCGVQDEKISQSRLLRRLIILTISSTATDQRGYGNFAPSEGFHPYILP